MGRPTTRTSLAAAIAAAVAMAAVPAGVAQAAVIKDLDNQCFIGGDTVPIEGSGFTAFAQVTITVNQGRSVITTADSAGQIRTSVKAPAATGDAVAPRSFTVTATDGSNPGNVVPAISMFVTRTRPASNAPVEGNPNAVTTWEFANFKPGRWIYGHFRFKGTTQRTIRFGRAGEAPCGLLSVRARRVPVP
ncbi:MAG TPA: hypothetical protein VGP78_13060, partial [Solirubrobacteraceae bacterium]|nr:hypothetical protein [Solirubrobacteraceae bacterium]